MIFKKVEDTLSVLKSIPLPIEPYTHPEFYKFYLEKELINSDEAFIIEKITSSLQLLLTISEQKFFIDNVSNESTYCSTIFLLPEEFKAQSTVINILFDHKGAYIVPSKQFGNIWRVDLGRLTDFGKEIVEKMINQNLVPKEITDVYLCKPIVSDVKEEIIYEITSDDDDDDIVLENQSDFLNKLNNERRIRCIIMSGMTLEECKNSEVTKFLLKTKGKLYIYITNDRDNNSVFMKWLLWED